MRRKIYSPFGGGWGEDELYFSATTDRIRSLAEINDSERRVKSLDDCMKDSNQSATSTIEHINAREMNIKSSVDYLKDSDRSAISMIKSINASEMNEKSLDDCLNESERWVKSRDGSINDKEREVNLKVDLITLRENQPKHFLSSICFIV